MVGNFIFDRAIFFAWYRQCFGRLTGSMVADIELLLGKIEQDRELKQIEWIAYMLATVKHECAGLWRPVIEVGHRSYFDKYEPGTPLGDHLGNTKPGDGWLFRGRGYVQITGRANYARMSKELGFKPGDDLVEIPDMALWSWVAYRVMSVGMRKGLFTGRSFDHYGNEIRIGREKTRSYDYVNARRIINGTDQASRIAGYADGFEVILKKAQVKLASARRRAEKRGAL